MQLSTFEEERREALESVLQAMAAGGRDAARTAACNYLLRHLTRPSVPMSGGRSLAGTSLAEETCVIEERRLKPAAG